jgi:hypothetical protein
MSTSREDRSGRSGEAAIGTRADLVRRFADTFLLLNEISSSLALIERSCSQALERLPTEHEARLSCAPALRAARASAHATLEQLGNLADTLTALLRFFSHKRPVRERTLATSRRRSSE